MGKRHHFKSEKARKQFFKACGHCRGVNPRWHCGNRTACKYLINKAHGIELSFLLVEKGWE